MKKYFVVEYYQPNGEYRKEVIKADNADDAWQIAKDRYNADNCITVYENN